MSKLFGGKDPFDDPFFTTPFSGLFPAQSNAENRSKEVTIEEVDSDGNPLKQSEPSKELVAKKPNGKQANGSKFSFQRVAYGGLNGMYYSASLKRKTGDDGVVMMEINEEDKTVGQALNTISKGIRDKGLSVTTKRSSDGKVDTLQTLHNLNEDELGGFEDNWKANEQKLPAEPDWKYELPVDWNYGFKFFEDAAVGSGKAWDWWPSSGGWALPFAGHSTDAGGTVPRIEDGASSGGRAKKIVQVNID